MLNAKSILTNREIGRYFSEWNECEYYYYLDEVSAVSVCESLNRILYPTEYEYGVVALGLHFSPLTGCDLI